MRDLTGTTALVTGGGGFIGRRVVELLVQEGATVRFLARSKYPEVEALGATGLQVDLRDLEALKTAVTGADVVVHVASKTDAWGPRDAFFSTNVGGTQNLLDACRAAGVPRLVYTSTPSVVGYEHDVENGPQDLPYASRHLFWYPESKAEAEQRVLAANSPELATVALRPHLVIGPADNHTLPGLIQRAHANALIQVGPGTNRVDMTDVDNAAWAHVDAVRALTDHTAPCAGKPYFISNDEPVVLWDWIHAVLAALELPGPRARVGLGLASMLGAGMEWAWRTFDLKGQPRVTRMIAAGLARDHWYDMGPAKRDLGYTVRLDMAAATERTVLDLRSRMDEIIAGH
jgi:nucleoside-diphosphate-sugar epimerase